MANQAPNPVFTFSGQANLQLTDIRCENEDAAALEREVAAFMLPQDRSDLQTMSIPPPELPGTLTVNFTVQVNFNGAEQRGPGVQEQQFQLVPPSEDQAAVEMAGLPAEMNPTHRYIFKCPVGPLLWPSKQVLEELLEHMRTKPTPIFLELDQDYVLRTGDCLTLVESVAVAIYSREADPKAILAEADQFVQLILEEYEGNENDYMKDRFISSFFVKRYGLMGTIPDFSFGQWLEVKM